MAMSAARRATPARVAGQQAAARARRAAVRAKGGAKKVDYGSGWFSSTDKAAADTVARQIGRRVEEDAKRGRKDRADLYTDNWDGSEYKGSKFNFATILGLLFILTPAAGLAFAYLSYGVLWG